jgi:hypothetical protein
MRAMKKSVSLFCFKTLKPILALFRPPAFLINIKSIRDCTRDKTIDLYRSRPSFSLHINNKSVCYVTHVFIVLVRGYVKYTRET